MKTVLQSLGLVMLVGCLKVPGVPEDFKLDQPRAMSSHATLCQDPSLQADDFCMPGSQMETWLRDGQIRFLDGKPTSTGASGAMKMLVGVTHPSVPDELVFNVKWKPAAAKLAGLNNSPRKELAAYALQKLFLNEDEWVVPPTVMRCLPTAPGRDLLPDRAAPKDIDCVWGMLSYWLDNLEAPQAIDLARWDADPAYRRALANLNIFMYLIGHRDTHNGNWLVSTDPDRVRAVSIDNGVAFSGFKNPKHELDWSRILVPALPADIVERLARISDGDLASLMVVGRWQTQDRAFVYTGDWGLTSKPHAGVVYKDGRLDHGLKDSEIRTVRHKILRLLDRVDKGKIQTF